MPNIKARLLRDVAEALGVTVSAPDMMAYLAAIAAHPAYTARFQADLIQPGLRFPLTAEAVLFARSRRAGAQCHLAALLRPAFCRRFWGTAQACSTHARWSTPSDTEGRGHINRSGPIPQSHRVQRRGSSLERGERIHRQCAASYVGVPSLREAGAPTVVQLPAARAHPTYHRGSSHTVRARKDTAASVARRVHNGAHEHPTCSRPLGCA